MDGVGELPGRVEVAGHARRAVPLRAGDGRRGAGADSGRRGSRSCRVRAGRRHGRRRPEADSQRRAEVAVEVELPLVGGAAGRWRSAPRPAWRDDACRRRSSAWSATRPTPPRRRRCRRASLLPAGVGVRLIGGAGGRRGGGGRRRAGAGAGAGGAAGVSVVRRVRAPPAGAAVPARRRLAGGLGRAAEARGPIANTTNAKRVWLIDQSILAEVERSYGRLGAEEDIHRAAGAWNSFLSSVSLSRISLHCLLVQRRSHVATGRALTR